MSTTQYNSIGEVGSQFTVGEVLLFHIRDGLCAGNKIETAKLRPVCRLGGPNYAKLGEIVSMQHVGNVVTGPGRVVAAWLLRALTPF